MKTIKKLSLNKQTIANLEIKTLQNVKAGIKITLHVKVCEVDTNPSGDDTNEYNTCGCTVAASCAVTCSPNYTCHTCPAETNPSEA